jgi:hypothetical protein
MQPLASAVPIAPARTKVRTAQVRMGFMPHTLHGWTASLIFKGHAWFQAEKLVAKSLAVPGMPYVIRHNELIAALTEQLATTRISL